MGDGRVDLENHVLSWAPPIPSIGRGGHRTQVSHGTSFSQRLKQYYLETDSSPDFFVRRIPAKFLRESGLVYKYKTTDLYLKDLLPMDQYRFIRSRMYGRDYSLHFKRKLTSELNAGRLSHVRQWFYTANGVVLPYIIGGGDDYNVIDSMTKFVMENCASNYAQFISCLKTTKKLMRKSAAVFGLSNSTLKVEFNGKTRTCFPYVRLFKSHLRTLSKAPVKERFRSLLFWTQSRATGIADARMVEESFDKFRRTTSEISVPTEIDASILKTCINSGNLTGHGAQVSCGPKACLQAPQAPVLLEGRDYVYPERAEPVGGQTRYLQYLASHNVLHYEYDPKTLDRTAVAARPVKSPTDLLSWAIQESIADPRKVCSVRYHAVAEQSKSRSITVAHYGYQVIMGVLAHALTPAVLSAETRSGLTSDRHLWNFLDVNLSPEVPSWEGFAGEKVAAMSSDLSEATDHMNWWFGRAVWSEYIRQTRGRMQPTGLMLLAKTLYTSPRTVYYRKGGTMYKWFHTRRAALMGDLFTKVVLTIAQDYTARKALYDSPIGRMDLNKREAQCMVKPYNLDTLSRCGQLDVGCKRRVIHGAAYSLVGDDIIIVYIVILSLHRHGMLPYFREASKSSDLLISELDSFDSPHLMFYCEEGAMVPSGVLETPRHQRWRGREVTYLDYPRLRLLLPVKMEQDIYSHTNVGRFSLLGKESRWTVDTSSVTCVDLYESAQLVQHLLVPRDIECLCPYTPQEIGGDGSYTNDPDLFIEIIRRKSSDPAETLYRMECQMVKMWSHHYVASDKPRMGVMKHHLLLPTLDRLRKWLPERAVIVPPSAEHAEIFRSLPRGILESPGLTFQKLVKRCYYGHLFNGGKILPNLRIRADVASKRGSTPASELFRWFDRERLEEYLSRWRRPGFFTRDHDPYFVVPYRHKDMLSVNWQWKPRPEPATDFSRLGVNDFLDTILYGKDNPVITQRLNMFFESDPLILIRVRQDANVKGRILLVSWDSRLAAQIVGFVRSNRDRRSVVQLVHPIVFFLGRVEEIPHDVLIEDAGAINFVGRNAVDQDLGLIACNAIKQSGTTFPGVNRWSVEGFRHVSRKDFRQEEAEFNRFISGLHQGDNPPEYSME